MIKINLLPRNLYEKQIVRNIAVLFLVAILATAGGLFYYKTTIDAKTEEFKQMADTAEAEKARIAGINSQADAEMAKVAPIQGKLMFFAGVAQFNGQIPQLYENLAKFTYKGVQYTKLTPAGGQLAIEGYTPNLSNLGRYMLNMYKADSLFQTVSLTTSIPGYPAAQGVPVAPGTGGAPAPDAGPSPGYVGATSYGNMQSISQSISRTLKLKGFNFSVICTLKTPVTAPTAPGAAAAAAPGAAPGVVMPPGQSASPPPPPPPGQQGTAGMPTQEGQRP